MHMPKFPFGVTDWSQIERTEHKGEQGLAYWRTRHFGDVRVRMVEYVGVKRTKTERPFDRSVSDNDVTTLQRARRVGVRQRHVLEGHRNTRVTERLGPIADLEMQMRLRRVAG